MREQEAGTCDLMRRLCCWVPVHQAPQPQNQADACKEPQACLHNCHAACIQTLVQQMQQAACVLTIVAYCLCICCTA
jgi:hypothetical protein